VVLIYRSCFSRFVTDQKVAFQKLSLVLECSISTCRQKLVHSQHSGNQIRSQSLGALVEFGLSDIGEALIGREWWLRSFVFC